MTVAAGARDLADVRAGLQRWFATRHPDDEVRVGPLGKPTTGYSSETLLVDVVRTARGHETEGRFVARLPPAGGGIFPDYDLTRQADVQRALRANGIPAAAAIAVELDERWIGAPFFLMDRVDGIALGEGYVASGPLFDASADTQRSVQDDFVDALADVHRLDWEAADLGALTPAGERGLAHDVARVESYATWAADGDVPAVHRDAFAWLHARRPDPEPPLGLCWGDPRLGNVLYDTSWSQQALLDWEMASIGPAEMDLAWFVGLHEVTAETAGADLPGFVGRGEVLDRWAVRAGRPVVAFDWFEMFSLVRADSIFLRIRAMLLAAGTDAPWLRGETPGQARIASRIR